MLAGLTDWSDFETNGNELLLESGMGVNCSALQSTAWVNTGTYRPECLRVSGCGKRGCASCVALDSK